MMTNAVICLHDRKRAGRSRCRGTRLPGHDGEPLPRHHAEIARRHHWPSPPVKVPWTEELLDQLIEGGYLLCGTPEEVCEQVVRYGDVGCDQVVFGLPGEGIEHEEILEMLHVFGDQVIREFDKDPVHSTTRYRENATPRFAEFNQPVPDVVVEILPETALLPCPERGRPAKCPERGRLAREQCSSRLVLGCRCIGTESAS